MKKKLLTSAIMLMLILFMLVPATFAYWSSIQNEHQDEEELALGSGREVTVTLEAKTQDDSVLVPLGLEDQSNEENAASSILVSFDILWQDSALYSTTSILSVSFSNYVLGTLSEIEITEMFSFAVISTNDIEKDVIKNVIIEVIFYAEPANVSIYEQVANNILSFNVTFFVEVPSNPNE